MVFNYFSRKGFIVCDFRLQCSKRFKFLYKDSGFQALWFSKTFTRFQNSVFRFQKHSQGFRILSFLLFKNIHKVSGLPIFRFQKHSQDFRSEFFSKGFQELTVFRYHTFTRFQFRVPSCMDSECLMILTKVACLGQLNLFISPDLVVTEIDPEVVEESDEVLEHDHGEVLDVVVTQVQGEGAVSVDVLEGSGVDLGQVVVGEDQGVHPHTCHAEWGHQRHTVVGQVQLVDLKHTHEHT